MSIYALKVLNTPGHIPLKKQDFIDFFREYYKGKSTPIKKGTIDDVLEYLICNTGILYLKDGCYVQFTHDSYMEYYAALEIFKHNRSWEDQLVDNFFDPNWQNTAVFYAGESKDMPQFLGKVRDKIRSSSNLNEYMSCICGAGYLLQALYSTDNVIRKEVIQEVLAVSLKNLDVFKVMSESDVAIFKNYKLPILHLINFIYFYESFNSITLSEPLKMAFADCLMEYRSTHDSSVGYNMLELAFTLDSKRIKYQDALQTTIYESGIIRDPSLNILASISIDCLGKERYKDYRNELKRVALSSLSDIQKQLVEVPVKKLRFTALDSIRSKSRVTLFVEGKTDAIILEQAFMVLTEGSMPYWSVFKAGHNEEIGSSEEVLKTLETSYAHWKSQGNSVIIGLFDHDAAGLSAFGKLQGDFSIYKGNPLVKKHKDGDIYALCLPIPGEMEEYLREKQVFNFFEIEHYLGHDYLASKNMLKETDIPGLFTINDSSKSKFAAKLRMETSPELFKHFELLFLQIDAICEATVNYVC